MAIANSEVFTHTDAKVVLHDAGAATPRRTLVKLSGNDRFGITLTDTVGVARTDLNINLGAGVTISGRTQPGVGNSKATAIDPTDAVAVATDGTWEFSGVASAADGTGTSSVSAAQGAPVYFHAGTGKLTTTAVSNNLVGYVNYPGTYNKVAGKLPVKIGA